MIAIKARRAIVSVAVLIDGEPRAVQVERPQGLEHRAEAMPAEETTESGTTLWIVDDDAVPEDDPRRAGPLDAPVRADLPIGHPLRGKRALMMVPAGCPDLTIQAGGRVVPVEIAAEPMEIEP